MGIRKLALVAAVGVSMASSPVMAQSNAPVSAPVAERSGADLAGANDQFGRDRDFRPGGAPFIVAFFVVLAVGLGLAVAFDLFGDDDGDRVSP